MRSCLTWLLALFIVGLIASFLEWLPGAIKSSGDWLVGSGVIYNLKLLLASAGLVIALGAVVVVIQAVSDGITRSQLEARADLSEEDRKKYEEFLSRVEQRKLAANANRSEEDRKKYEEFLAREELRQLEANADRSEEDRKKYEEFLAREEQQRIRAEEPKQEQLLESQRRTRWKEYPKQSILKALADDGEPCLLVSLLKGRRSFIAVSKDELKLVLGAVNIDNESLGHHQAFAGPEMIGVDSGDKLKVSTFTNGSGGLVVFGDIDSGSKGSQTAHDSRVMSSCIFLTVRDMVSPLKQIVFDSPIECRQWLGRIKIIQTSYLKYLSGLEADRDVDDDWSRDDLSPWDDDSLEE